MNYWFEHRPSSWVVKPSCNAFIFFYTRSITGLRKWTILHKWSCLIVPHQIPQYPVSTSKNRYVALFSPPKIAAPSRLSALIAGRSCPKGPPFDDLTNVRLNFRRCALNISNNKILCVYWSANAEWQGKFPQPFLFFYKCPKYVYAYFKLSTQLLTVAGLTFWRGSIEILCSFQKLVTWIDAIWH